MIDQLKDLKDTYESARTQIDRLKEPVDDLTKLNAFLKAVASDPSIFHEKMDKDYKRYFLEDFTHGMLKRLTKEKPKNNQYLELIGSVLEQFILIFIQQLRDENYNFAFFDSIRLIFDYETMLHQLHYQIPEDQLKRIKIDNNTQDWRKDLKVGDMVDAVQDEVPKCPGWSQAKIVEVSGDTLKLEYIFDTKNLDKFLDRWSVDIAPFESKTKELFAWKKESLQIKMQVDAHDKSNWKQSTILDMKEQQIGPERYCRMAYVGFRVYVAKSIKSDEIGPYEGFSNRFDEWISVYSPRIQPFYSKTQKGLADEEFFIDEELDALFTPEEGHSKVYAVPRLRKCTSSLYIHLINLFGNQGGYEIIMKTFEQAQSNESFNFNVLACLLEMISKPYLIYNTEFQKSFSMKLAELSKTKIKNIPDKILRDIKREKLEGFVHGIDFLQRRNVVKDQREQDTENLKLDLCLQCLRSQFLDRKIQGLRDLNEIIKTNRYQQNKVFTNEQLIEWMHKNDVFSVLFDNKKTHIQIVQRCADILRLLLQEDKLTLELTAMFWNLSKSDFKPEVYKIVHEGAALLKEEHISFIFDQIQQIPQDKLTMEEFQCLAELGKFCANSKFRDDVTSFFWKVIYDSESFKEELVTNCVTKFSEMVKLWDIQKKHPFFILLIKNLQEGRSSIPSIKLFKSLIKDHLDNKKSTSDSSQISSYPSKPAQSEGDEAAQEIEEQEKEEFTIQQSIKELLEKHNLIETLMQNFIAYQEKAQSALKESNLSVENRKKLFILSQKNSHHVEIDERIQFIKYIASISSDFQISKKELGVIYDHLVQKSSVPSDYEEFLIWCKSSCKQSSSNVHILDLDEIGQFFIEKMNNKELDLKNLLQVGFDFLQHYFLSVNEKNQKLLKAQEKKKETNKIGSYPGMYGFYGPMLPGYFDMSKKQNDAEDQEEDDSNPVFQLLKPPGELEQLNIVWNIALQCQNEKVIPKAINFLIRVYTCLDEDLKKQKIAIQDSLIESCMKLLRESQDEQTINRLLLIIKNIIYEAEKKGTGGVQPHNAVLKGELLEKIIVKNKATTKKGNLIMSVYSNTTVWEFRKEVAQQLDLAPKYLKLVREDESVLKDMDNGKTLAYLNFKPEESLSAFKLNIEEEVAVAPLIGSDGKLTERASNIFNEWFDMYSDEQGSMTKDTCVLFIKGCTGETPASTDDRIVGLFKNYDKNGDGRIEREEFMQFYETAAKTKQDTVRENLRAHNIRADLKKLSEIQEESSYTKEDMPRYKISKTQQYFDLLMTLLDRGDSTSSNSWDLIQMLSTNEVLYRRVLELQTAKGENDQTIDWNKFFDASSLYKLLYTLQIVEAVMEDSKGERITIIEEESQKKNIPPPPPLPVAGTIPPPPGALANVEVGESPSGNQIVEEVKQSQEVPKMNKATSIVEDDEVNKQLRSGWTKMFVEAHGFEYILNIFLQKQIQTSLDSGNEKDSFKEQFELKHTAFILKILHIFILASFSSLSENQENQDQSEASKFEELREMLKGEKAQQLIGSLNFSKIQNKILELVTQILEKQEMIFEDKLIIENALDLWVGCVQQKKELLNEFYKFNQQNKKISTCQEFILTGLLYCNQEKIREEFNIAMGQICKNVSGVEPNPLEFFLHLLSENFSQISNFPCKQYFELFCDLIDQHFESSKTQQYSGKFDPQSILVAIIDKIKEYNKIAQEMSSDINQENCNEKEKAELENIYIGLIQLTGKIIDNFDIQYSEQIVEKNNLIDEIFAKFLFQSVFAESANAKEITTIKIKQKFLQRFSGQNQTKGFGKKSKDSAYKLLNSLIKKSSLLMNSFLSKSLIPLMNLIRRLDGWNYSPPGSSEKVQKYCGLRNLGCICYMNSMIQQFFMIPSFRYNLLCVDDYLPEDLQEYKGYQIDDNVLHQFQKLVAHLELSERSDYNPFEFCFAFKDLDGNPTNTGEQKDAQEFLNLIFDRLENQLRGTSRKYLLQSVFGGQTCSQMVCQECGKVRNRIEDFYNLSLPVKDIKSMEESLKKMIDGEVINDYLCEGCNKKVDISRRTLLSQAPNVLIVHLQRIFFNFDTFRNDKINTYWEFPNQLDLTPYSFYEVMRKEQRIGGEKAEDDQEEPKQDNNQEENQWPEEEDCFEYKLVGVNVHSGTANAGHYWSYINTARGFAEQDSDKNPNWEKTENDPWMEFNDSTVRDFSFSKLQDDCFGGDKKKSGGDTGGWSFGDSSYGKSAYMLVYERKKKRPIKILLQGDDLEEQKQANESEILFDEKKQEFYKFIDYKNGVEEIKPNSIYKQVFEDNMKFEFENDIYSQEFFDFISGIVKAVTKLVQPGEQSLQQPLSSLMKELSENCMKVGKKGIFEIVAKCFYNKCITDMVFGFIDLFKAEESLCSIFMQQCYEEDQFEYLLQLLLECSDAQARNATGMFLRHIVNVLKIKEKDLLYSTVEIESVNQKQEKVTEVQSASLCVRFICKCISVFNTKAAKNWLKLDNFLEVIQAFALGEQTESTQESEEDKLRAKELEAIGLEFCFKTHFLEKACDFVLGKKSPLCQLGEKRQDMGGSYTSPNFSSLIKIITRMITEEEGYQVKYPFTDLEKKMLLQHDLLKVMLGSSSGSKQFGKCLANMCKDNYKLTRKVSKVFVKSINNANYDTVKNYLTALKPFLKVQDNLKMNKLEWVFGYSHIQNKKGFREERFKYGIDTMNNINDDATIYVSPIATGPTDDPLLGQLLKCKGRLDTFAINCIKEMLSLMTKDEDICKFIYEQGPPTYQLARYFDWIKPYLEQQRLETEKNAHYSYMKAKFETILKCIRLYEELEQKFIWNKITSMETEVEEKLNSENCFTNLNREEDWWAFNNLDVIKHFPPQVIIGKQIGGAENEKVFYQNDENPLVTITIHEIENEYCYGNPTGYFNITLPNMELKTSNYQTMTYVSFKQMAYKVEQKQKQLQEQNQQQTQEGETNSQEPNDQNKQEQKEQPQQEQQEQPQAAADAEILPEFKVINWVDRCKQGPLLLRVTATTKSKAKVSVAVSFKAGESCNTKLPITGFKEHFFDAESKCLGHLVKIDPTQGWGDIQVSIEVKEKSAVPQPPSNQKINPGTIDMMKDILMSVGAIFIGDFRQLGCASCNKLNDMNSTNCIQCGSRLIPEGVGIALGTHDMDDDNQDQYFELDP